MVTEIKTKTVNKNIKTLNKTVTATEHIEHIRLALQGYNYGNGAIVQVALSQEGNSGATDTVGWKMKILQRKILVFCRRAMLLYYQRHQKVG